MFPLESFACNAFLVRDSTFNTCGTSAAAAPFLFVDDILFVDVAEKEDDGPNDDKSGNVGRSSPHVTSLEDEWLLATILFAIVACGRVICGAERNLASRITDSS